MWFWPVATLVFVQWWTWGCEYRDFKENQIERQRTLWEPGGQGFHVPSRHRCSDQTQRFWPRPRWLFDGRTQPLCWAFYIQDDTDAIRTSNGDMKGGTWKMRFPLQKANCCLYVVTWRRQRSPCGQVCELVWVRAGRDTLPAESREKKGRATSFLVVQTESHKSVTGQFLCTSASIASTYLKQKAPIFSWRGKKRLLWCVHTIGGVFVCKIQSYYKYRDCKPCAKMLWHVKLGVNCPA